MNTNNTKNLLRPIQVLAVVALVIVAVIFAGAKTEAPTGIVRVKLCSLEKTVTLVGENMTWKAQADSGRTNRIRLVREGGHLNINGQKISAATISISAPGPIAVDGHPYHGSLTAVTAAPSCLVNNLEVETYVAGVINQEMDSRWSAAAVDAQAIIARTYALKKRSASTSQYYDLDRTVEDQVYGGIPAEDKLALAAVERTRGKVLTYNGDLVLPNYHACCGGRTELPSAVWNGPDLPWQQSVVCPHCQSAPRFFWRFPQRGSISGAELAALLGTGAVTDVTVSGRTETGRAKEITVATASGPRRVSGFDFRKKVGYDRLFSTAFEVEADKGGFVFRGSGSGHGAGLCQYGAKGMAEKGYNASSILAFYYPGTKVERFSGK